MLLLSSSPTLRAPLSTYITDIVFALWKQWIGLRSPVTSKQIDLREYYYYYYNEKAFCCGCKVAIIILNASLSTRRRRWRARWHTLPSTTTTTMRTYFTIHGPQVSYMWERMYSLGRNKGVRILVYYNYDAKGSLMTTTTSTQQQLLLRIKSKPTDLGYTTALH